MTTSGGGIRSIDCPECAEGIDISVPYSAEIVSVITHPQTDEHEVARTEIDRPRENEIQCGNAHTVSIRYDW